MTIGKSQMKQPPRKARLITLGIASDEAGKANESEDLDDATEDIPEGWEDDDFVDEDEDDEGPGQTRDPATTGYFIHRFKQLETEKGTKRAKRELVPSVWKKRNQMNAILAGDAGLGLGKMKKLAKALNFPDRADLLRAADKWYDDTHAIPAHALCRRSGWAESCRVVMRAGGVDRATLVKIGRVALVPGPKEVTPEWLMDRIDFMRSLQGL